MADVRFSLSYLISSYLTPAGKRAAWNLSWMLGSTAISQISLFGVVLILTRALDREQFGMLATGLAMQGYLILLGSAGMPIIATREMVRRALDHSCIASTFMAVSLILGIVAAVATIIVLSLLRISPSERVVWIALLLSAGVACANPQFLFDAFHKQRVPSITTAAIDLTFLGIALLLLYRGNLGIIPAGILFSAKWIFSTVLIMILFRGYVSLSPAYVKFEEACFLLRSSWPILLASFLYMIPTSSGVIFVRAFHGPEHAAIVGLAVQAFQVFTTVVGLANRIVRPHINSPWGFTKNFLLKLIVFYTAFVFALYLVACLGLHVIVEYLLPESYAGTKVAGLVLLVGGVGVAFASLANEYLIALNRQTAILYSFALASTAFIAATLVFVPRFGVLAQCIATSASMFLILCVNLVVLSFYAWPQPR